MRRRDFVTAAGARAAQEHAHAQAQDHEHEHQVVPSDLTLRVKSLESLLVEKGLVDPAALDALIDTYEHKVGPRNGARVVARAWTDPAYKQRLLADGTARDRRTGLLRRAGRAHRGAREHARKSTTWSSARCARATRGRSSACRPVWYKSAPYRSRAVIDPRGVLREFGIGLPADIEVRVWDTTAELRYLVLPERPAGTENLTEEALAALVTRDAMIGVARWPPEAAR